MFEDDKTLQLVCMMPTGRRQNKVCIERNRKCSRDKVDNCSLVSIKSEVFVSKQDCAKLVKELNREISRYCTMVVCLGGSQDSECLREDLKTCRHCCYDLARQVRQALLPNLTREPMIEHMQDFNRLWRLYILCLDMLEAQVRRTIHLLKKFPFYLNCSKILINTGISDPVHFLCKHSVKMVTLDSLDTVPTVDKKVLEREEIKTLDCEIFDLHDLIAEMHRVEVKPWSVESEMLPNIDYESRSIKSNSDAASSMVEIVSINESNWQNKRKCICLIALLIVCVVVFAAILGVCIALFT